MPSWVIVDSGILLATVLLEPLTPKAKALVRYWNQNDFQMAAPVLLRYEVVSVIRKSVARKSITPEEAIIGREKVMGYPVQLMLDDALLKCGYELATQFNRPAAYDEQYLALAERLNCDFWTVDERLYNSFKADLKWVKWLGDFQSET